MEVVLSALNRATPVRLSNLVGTSVSLFNLSRAPPFSPQSNRLSERYTRIYSIRISSRSALFYETRERGTGLYWSVGESRRRIGEEFWEPSLDGLGPSSKMYLEHKPIERIASEQVRSFIVKCKIVGEEWDDRR